MVAIRCPRSSNTLLPSALANSGRPSPVRPTGHDGSRVVVPRNRRSRARVAPPSSMQNTIPSRVAPEKNHPLGTATVSTGRPSRSTTSTWSSGKSPPRNPYFAPGEAQMSGGGDARSSVPRSTWSGEQWSTLTSSTPASSPGATAGSRASWSEIEPSVGSDAVDAGAPSAVAVRAGPPLSAPRPPSGPSLVATLPPTNTAAAASPARTTRTLGTRILGPAYRHGRPIARLPSGSTESAVGATGYLRADACRARAWVPSSGRRASRRPESARRDPRARLAPGPPPTLHLGGRENGGGGNRTHARFQARFSRTYPPFLGAQRRIGACGCIARPCGRVSRPARRPYGSESRPRGGLRALRRLGRRTD